MTNPETCWRTQPVYRTKWTSNGQTGSWHGLAGLFRTRRYRFWESRLSRRPKERNISNKECTAYELSRQSGTQVEFH
jgi:hypothetical protein